MRMQIRRAAAAVLAGMMAAMAQPIASSAADAPKKIVVIGDSVSAGTGLDNPNATYVKMVSTYYHAEVVDLSKDACTSGDLLVMLDDPAVQSELSKADMILCTVGIQDIMVPFNNQLDVYRTSLGFDKITDLYSASRSDIDVSDDDLNAYSLVLAKCLEKNEESCRDNILAIGEKLSAYQNAEIVCPNVYNPLNCIEGLDGMTIKRRIAYNSIMNPCNYVLTDSVNASYTKLGEQYGFRIVDTFSGFAGLAYDYTYLYSMDYNPTRHGHHWIAEAITGAKLETISMLGDVSKNESVGAEDASEVLMVAAEAGSGQNERMTEAFKAMADVNFDGEVNAVDASAILEYAAAVGAGEEVTPISFFGK